MVASREIVINKRQLYYFILIFFFCGTGQWFNSFDQNQRLTKLCKLLTQRNFTRLVGKTGWAMSYAATKQHENITLHVSLKIRHATLPNNPKFSSISARKEDIQNTMLFKCSSEKGNLHLTKAKK